jgi:diguanylate cyclase (GGDEF)-like protein/PAS domain S-box-containing protein
MAAKSKSSIKLDKNNQSQQDDLSNLAKAIISNAGVGIYIIQHGKFVYVSELYQKLTGYSDTELIGTCSLNNIHPDDIERVRERAIKCLKGKSFEPYEYGFVKKNNEVMRILETITPIEYKGERAALGSFMDITERKQAESQREDALEALRESEERYKALFERSLDIVYIIDFEGRFIDANETALNRLGYTREDLRSFYITYLLSEDQLPLAIQTIQDLQAGIQISSVEFRLRHKNGSEVYVETQGSVIMSNGRPAAIQAVARDITERKRVEEVIRQSEEKYRTILETIQEAYFEVDLTGNFTFFNDSMCRLTGCSKKELFGVNYSQFSDKENSKNVFKVFNNIYTKGEPSEGFDWQIIRKDGTRRYIESSVSLQKDSSGNPTGFKGMIRDITERKRIEQQLNYMATHDALTGLPNRLMFSRLLDHAIQAARRYKRQFAVLFIDLDRFKIINDSMGHDAGDQLLQEIATRFKQSLRAVDVVGRLEVDNVGRLGGDEFIILIEEVSEMSQVATVAHKILTAAIKPIVILGEECRVTASIGISIYPQDGEDEQSLMKNADIAMYFAKEEGKNNYQFYSKDLQSKSIERLSIETNMRLALERKEFSLQYQAKLDIKTGMITGVEALLRWQNPFLGSITPTQFIPVAEETGLIVPIGRWVMKTACAQNIAWQRQGLPPVCVAVNLSLRQLTDDNLLEDIKDALKDSGMAPNLLELEITESMIMHNPARLIAVLINIKKMGVRLALDDFGTGYSSLAHIKHFPIDTLKVDRSFIRNLQQDSEDRAITKAIIAMGKTLSLTVVAEGVETQEQEDFLREHICDEMQGFYFSKPIEPDQFGDLLHKHRPSL